MLPIFIGGVISGIGSAVGGFLGYKGQKDTNRTNMQLGQDQMDFQERMVNQAQDFEKEMSSSAYQRAMTDMKKAGLNPMLAYQQGGASTPIGKTAPALCLKWPIRLCLPLPSLKASDRLRLLHQPS